MALALAVRAGEPVALGSRLELFVDHFVIEKLTGGAALHLHRPEPQEVVLVTDQPWEGNTSAYFTVFQDGDLYRMYYRGSHFNEAKKRKAHREVACYAESRDGITWTKPALGLFAFEGSKENNIVWDGLGTHNFTAFKDTNPACPARARYKALGRGRDATHKALHAFVSPDGIHWSMLRPEPVITKGAFDSQNLAFWDPAIQRYREYHRTFRNGVRDIQTSTSGDFVTWTDPEFLVYPGAPREHLYTNAIRLYERAPHLFLGFPTRFLPDRGQQVEPIFMTSRDGLTFHRWSQALIPATAPEERDGNRSNYMTYGLVTLPGNDREYSVYATEGYYTGRSSRVRRFTYRIDGFVSVRAPAGGGEVLTKPLTFTGKRLIVNAATAPQGSLRVELQAADGAPIEGRRLADAVPFRGDEIETTVRWKNGSDLSRLASTPVRVRFVVKDADLFSMRFR
jgi:hypothetical protein